MVALGAEGADGEVVEDSAVDVCVSADGACLEDAGYGGGGDDVFGEAVPAADVFAFAAVEVSDADGEAAGEAVEGVVGDELEEYPVERLVAGHPGGGECGLECEQLVYAVELVFLCDGEHFFWGVACGVECADDCPHAAAGDAVGVYAVFFECLKYADVGVAECSAAAERDADAGLAGE